MDRLVIPGDARKAAVKIYELASMEKPPARLFLGRLAIESTRRMIKELQENLDSYEAWSEGLDA